jgi:hypothetical protein
MPVKGAPTKLNPVRLNTLNHLRVRRPNSNENNPCAAVLSSMLSMSSFRWLYGVELEVGLDRILGTNVEQMHPSATLSDPDPIRLVSRVHLLRLLE